MSLGERGARREAIEQIVEEARDGAGGGPGTDPDGSQQGNRIDGTELEQMGFFAGKEVDGIDLEDWLCNAGCQLTARLLDQSAAWNAFGATPCATTRVPESVGHIFPKRTHCWVVDCVRFSVPLGSLSRSIYRPDVQ
ncbi:hypothetical protein BH23CHL5_BH23CHL5_28450 [soil metagenome]